MLYEGRERLQGIEPNEFPNFMLSLRLRYHGQTQIEIADDTFNTLAGLVGKLSGEQPLLKEDDADEKTAEPED